MITGPTIPGRQSIRRDPRSGATEIASFSGPHDNLRFSITHLPARNAWAGVVVCSPIKYEHMKFYRVEVALARTLVNHGIAVQRFHYRGAGHSDGANGAMTYGSMLEDALAGADRLRMEAGVARLAFVGTRVGALVAAAAAARFERAPLLLWEPVMDADDYVLEIVRAERLSQLRSGRPVVGDRPARGTLESLVEHGELEALGFKVERRLYDSLKQLELASLLGCGQGLVLLMQLARGDGLRRKYAALVNRLTALGCDIELTAMDRDLGWWFESTDHDEWLIQDLVPFSADWMATALGSVAAS